eukprot:scaffold5144_cov141-Ochromonas_danica.AAC.2
MFIKLEYSSYKSHNLKSIGCREGYETNKATPDTSIDCIKLNPVRHWSEIVSSEEIVERFRAGKVTNGPATKAQQKELVSALKIVEMANATGSKQEEKEQQKEA